MTEELSRKSETALVNSAALQGLRETEFYSPVWGHLLLGHRPLTPSTPRKFIWTLRCSNLALSWERARANLCRFSTHSKEPRWLLRLISHKARTEKPVGHCRLPCGCLGSDPSSSSSSPSSRSQGVPCWSSQPPHAKTASKLHSCSKKIKKQSHKTRYQTINNLKKKKKNQQVEYPAYPKLSNPLPRALKVGIPDTNHVTTVTNRKADLCTLSSQGRGVS